MERVDSEERLRKLLLAGDGFVYNDFAPGTRPSAQPSKSARYNTLHRADCRTLQASLTVAKYFIPDEEAAIGWLTAHRGRRTRRLAPLSSLPEAASRARRRSVAEARPSTTSRRFDENGDLVEAPVTIYRIAGKRAVVDRVVTASLSPQP